MADEIGQFGQSSGACAKAAQRGKRFVAQVLGVFAGSVKAKQGDIGRFVGGRILAGGFAEGGGIDAVENVVHHLKKQAGGAAKRSSC